VEKGPRITWWEEALLWTIISNANSTNKFVGLATAIVLGEFLNGWVITIGKHREEKGRKGE